MTIKKMKTVGEKSFKKQSIRQQSTIGEQLVRARERRQWSLEHCSQVTKIPAHHLEALEHGRYNDLPSPVYIKNYLRIYTKKLGMNWEQIEKQYEQEVNVYHNPDLPTQKTATVSSAGKRRRMRQVSSGSAHRRALLIPRMLKIGLISIVVLLFLVYITWSLVQFFSPPELTLLYPTEDVRVTERRVTISGQSEPEATVEINGQAAAVKEDGSFDEEIVLHTGLNTIQVSTKTRRSKSVAIERHILLEASETE